MKQWQMEMNEAGMAALPEEDDWECESVPVSQTTAVPITEDATHEYFGAEGECLADLDDEDGDLEVALQEMEATERIGFAAPAVAGGFTLPASSSVGWGDYAPSEQPTQPLLPKFSFAPITQPTPAASVSPFGGSDRANTALWGTPATSTGFSFGPSGTTAPTQPTAFSFVPPSAAPAQDATPVWTAQGVPSSGPTFCFGTQTPHVEAQSAPASFQFGASTTQSPQSQTTFSFGTSTPAAPTFWGPPAASIQSQASFSFGPPAANQTQAGFSFAPSKPAPATFHLSAIPTQPAPSTGFSFSVAGTRAEPTGKSEGLAGKGGSTFSFGSKAPELPSSNTLEKANQSKKRSIAPSEKYKITFDWDDSTQIEVPSPPASNQPQLDQDECRRQEFIQSLDQREESNKRKQELPVNEESEFDEFGEYQIELNSEEPTFLRQAEREVRKEVSIRRILSNPDGSMSRAATSASELAQERIQIRENQAAWKAKEMDSDERADTLTKLRTTSRMQYLKAREPKKIMEFREQIQDEEKLFGDQKLTQIEIARKKLDEAIYNATV